MRGIKPAFPFNMAKFQVLGLCCQGVICTALNINCLTEKTFHFVKVATEGFLPRPIVKEGNKICRGFDRKKQVKSSVDLEEGNRSKKRIITNYKIK